MLEVINLIISCIMQTISCTYIVGHICQKKLEYNKKNIIVLLIMTTLFYILMKLNIGMYKPLFIYVIVILGYKKIYNLSYNESISVNFISSILHLLGEIIISLIIIMSNIPMDIIQKYFQISPASSMMVLILMILIIRIFGKWLINLYEHLKKEKLMFYFYILVAIALVILFWRNLPNWKNVNIENFIVNIFIISLFITTVLLLFKGRYDVYRTNSKFDELFEQSESVKTLLQRYKKHNHENKNQLILIRENSAGNEKVIDYIDSILNEKVGHEDKWISELSHITDPGISGFLSVKINQMVDNEIKVSLTISPKVKNFKFENMKSKEYKEICRILGVYLDNAHEASKETEKKEVTIEMLLDKEILLIIISNSFIGEIELDKIDKEGYTTKGQNHGVGLSLVRDIIKSNKKLEQKREVIRDYYFQYLYIKN